MSNPYESPANLVDGSLPAPEVSRLELARRGFFRGALMGWLTGATAAALIGFLGECGLLYPNGAELFSRLEPSTTIFIVLMALIGGLLGGIGCSLIGLGAALIASCSQPSKRNILIFVVVCMCGIVGAVGGATAGFMLSGGGHDGEPIILRAIAIAAVIALVFGVIGGGLLGRNIANQTWGSDG